MIGNKVALFVLANTASALNNGFGRTPIMGYNTYNAVNCNPNQTFALAAMRTLAHDGYPDLGYKMFQIDCGWQANQRQSNGSVAVDTIAFPDGFSYLSQQAISNGFYWGMYTGEGYFNCGSNPPNGRVGSYGFEKQDALQYAGWNTVVVKVDNCWVDNSTNANHSPSDDFPTRFGAMSSALQSVGIKGMEVCQWGVPFESSTGLQGPAEWTPELATSFRVADDIAGGWNNVWRILNEAINVNLRGLNGPGHFADMDLLEVGNSLMTPTEEATHFAVWAMFKSQLVISANMDTISEAASTTLRNRALIAVNQDPLGAPVTLVQRYSNDHDLYAGPLVDDQMAVLLFDTSNAANKLSVDFSRFNISSATVTDLWTGKVTKDATSYSTEVSAHGSVPLQLSDIIYCKVSSPAFTWMEAESGTLSDGAAIQSCSGCSGGKKVGSIGGSSGGTLSLSGIKTSQATQGIMFDYINCDVAFAFQDSNLNVRGASISVNGGPGQSVLFPLTGYNWESNVGKGFLVQLEGFSTTGNNTLTIAAMADGSPYAPDLDRIGILL